MGILDKVLNKVSTQEELENSPLKLTLLRSLSLKKEPRGPDVIYPTITSADKKFKSRKNTSKFKKIQETYNLKRENKSAFK